MLAALALLVVATKVPGLETVKPLATAFHDLEAAAEKKRQPADEALLSRATALEHGLRDWLALQLPAPKTSILYAARVLATASRNGRDQIEVYRPVGFPEAIVVRVGLHVPGGTDGAAWLFEQRAGKWVQTASLERNQHRNASQLVGVTFSAADQSRTHLMVAVRVPAGVSGCWHPVAFQLYRVGTPTPPPLLLDDWHAAELCKHVPVAKADSNGFSIELEDRDLQPGTTRTHILRYRLTAEHPSRVQPVARTARQFVDEWLQRPWREAVDWTAPEVRKGLEKVHQELQGTGGRVSGQYRPDARCEAAGQSEITVDVENHGTRHFIVEETAPSEFKLLSVAASGCAAH